MTCVLRCLRLESLKVCFLHASCILRYRTACHSRLVIVGDTHGQLADVRNCCYLLAWGTECVVNEHGGTAHSVSSWTSQCSKQAGPTVWYLTTTSPCPAIRGTRLRYLFNGDMVDRGSQAMESGLFQLWQHCFISSLSLNLTWCSVKSPTARDATVVFFAD